jgi:hypothetical protein
MNMTIRWQGGMEMARIRKEERHRRTGTGVLILLYFGEMQKNRGVLVTHAGD